MRVVVSWVLMWLLPATIFAADTPAGVVYGSGPVYLNGAQLAGSMPAMLGDTVETTGTSVAHFDLPGSTAVVQSNAIVRFRDGGLALDRGTVSVATGRSLKVFARDFAITPTSSNWTQFEVQRSAGLIHIAAVKFDVEIKCGAQAPTIIREGHQITRPDAQNCGLETRSSGPPPAVIYPILGSNWAAWAGVAVAGSLLGWTLDQGGEPISADSP
jgi:hypothetical protein